jgi:hypothetical protein
MSGWEQKPKEPEEGTYVVDGEARRIVLARALIGWCWTEQARRGSRWRDCTRERKLTWEVVPIGGWAMTRPWAERDARRHAAPPIVVSLNPDDLR